MFSSCAYLNLDKIEVKPEEASFVQTEEAGSYKVQRSIGYNKDKDFISKTLITDMEKPDVVVEKSVTFSEVYELNKDSKIFRPIKSEAIYFLNGQKYVTKLALDYKKEIVRITMDSPEDQWNGTKEYSMPKGNGAICFYSIVTECAVVSSFFENAVKNNSGTMNFILVWEGYPYFHEQFLNLPPTPITEATISYDGRNSAGFYRFTLNAGGQSQFYFINKNGQLVNHYWSSQAYTRVRR
ncbi:hypothetical protein [Bacteriovorax sp. Seq25_V]|uniref:hypothetical protein n=1 Tax=Bacteriovorax sp. Seq25_V TaxID=1201288 RepID=UPI00038A513B|nr:hypothetical protein [Bacteriovorax sp. Seq25_V]EQC46933.1 hypothetical protein M900_2634 [Bacteriovorax sp. Seq25_V]